MNAMRNILLSLSLLTLAACGFHLRGSDLQDVRFGFKSLYLKTHGETPFVAELRRLLGKNKMQPVAAADQAELILEIVSENTTKQILSLSGSGRVREYQLGYRISMRAYDQQQVEWLPPDDVQLNRVLTYDDAEILAKEQEEAQLYKDMRADAVAQIVRRLMRAKPQTQE
ncbi:MAG: LPS assembly lipoprotein LptE [Sideroxydans sp.]|nr:LPS assembly lipoprotein LptE [Sideroxydans sp.]